MAIPDYQTVMLPLLKLLADGTPRHVKAVREHMISVFGLTEEEASSLIPSGHATYVADRVSWAQSYLKRAELIKSPSRGVYEITDRGLELLSKKPEKIDVALLHSYPEFTAWLGQSYANSKPSKAKPGQEQAADPERDETPEVLLDQSYKQTRAAVEAELLDLVKSMPPAFFERLVVELLVRMGYGGTIEDAGRAIGKSGDGGIDGVIKEDRLGLDVIHVQAKRWQGTVGRPEIQAFAGSLEGVRSRKGIFLTTSGFSQEAKGYVGKIEKRIVLVDGAQLAQLMYEHGLGTSSVAVYELKRVDSDYFVDQ